MVVCILTGLLQQSVDNTISTMTNVILKQNDTLASAIAPRGLPSTSPSGSHIVHTSSEVVDSDNATDVVERKVKAVSKALTNMYKSFGMETPRFNSPKALITAALDFLEDEELTEECSGVPLLSRLDIILTKGFKVTGW
jgi:hypothetical protein